MAFLRWLWLNSPNVARTAGGRSLQISSKSIGSTIGSVFHFLITWLLLTKPYRHPLIWSRLLSQPRWDYQKCHFKHFRFERLFRGLRIFGPMYFWLLSSTNSSSREQHCIRHFHWKSNDGLVVLRWNWMQQKMQRPQQSVRFCCGAAALCCLLFVAFCCRR